MQLGGLHLLATPVSRTLCPRKHWAFTSARRARRCDHAGSGPVKSAREKALRVRRGGVPSAGCRCRPSLAKPQVTNSQNGASDGFFGLASRALEAGTQILKGGQSSQSSRTVFVAGATGQLGERIVKELLAQGYRVRAGVRNRERAEDFVRSAAKRGLLSRKELARLDMVLFDLEDPSTLSAAIGSASRVVCAVAASEGLSALSAARKVDGEGVISLVEAAAQAGVQQFVMITSLGTGKFGFPAGLQNVFGGVLMWKRRAEEALERSGMPYVIIRPGGMARAGDDFKQRHHLRLEPRDTLFGGQVSRGQVAELVTACITNEDASRNKVLEAVAEASAPEVLIEDLLLSIPADDLAQLGQSGGSGGKEREALLSAELEQTQEQLAAAESLRGSVEGRVGVAGAEARALRRREAEVAREREEALKQAQQAEDRLARLAKQAELKARLAAAAGAVLSAVQQAVLPKPEAAAAAPAAAAPAGETASPQLQLRSAEHPLSLEGQPASASTAGERSFLGSLLARLQPHQTQQLASGGAAQAQAAGEEGEESAIADFLSIADAIEAAAAQAEALGLAEEEARVREEETAASLEMAKFQLAAAAAVQLQSAAAAAEQEWERRGAAAAALTAELEAAAAAAERQREHLEGEALAAEAAAATAAIMLGGNGPSGEGLMGGLTLSEMESAAAAAAAEAEAAALEAGRKAASLREKLEQMRRVQAEEAAAKYAQAQEERAVFEAQFAEALKELQSERGHVGQLEKELTTVRAELAARSIEIEGLKRDLSQANKTVEMLRAEVQALAAKLAAADEALAAEREASEAARAEAATLRSELFEVQTQLRREQETVARLEREGAPVANGDAERVVALEKMAGELRRQLQEAQAQAKAQDEAFKKAVAMREEMKAKQQEELQKERDRISQLELELQATKASLAERDRLVEQLRGDLASSLPGVKDMRNKIQMLMGKVSDMSEALAVERETGLAARSKAIKLQSEVADLRAALDKAQAGPAGQQQEEEKLAREQMKRLLEEVSASLESERQSTLRLREEAQRSKQQLQDALANASQLAAQNESLSAVAASERQLSASLEGRAAELTARLAEAEAQAEAQKQEFEAELLAERQRITLLEDELRYTQGSLRDLSGQVKDLMTIITQAAPAARN